MAHDCHAAIRWNRGDAAFTGGRYRRGHVRAFDGIEVPGSSDPGAKVPAIPEVEEIRRTARAERSVACSLSAEMLVIPRFSVA